MASATGTIEERLLDLEGDIYGSQRPKVDGLLARVERVEEAIQEWRDMKLTLRGIYIGLGLTGAVSVTTLITVLSQIAGVKGP